ncbi:hypothetical protein [Chromohalobacter japonicus]|uniref:hypothetical protein n=1 Tax=Chromohalobacter japonicus TaxID=223900 RepID=UPI0015CF5AEA|nr:hypothetical protein [Chromohalobacter japonicus]
MPFTSFASPTQVIDEWLGPASKTLAFNDKRPGMRYAGALYTQDMHGIAIDYEATIP